MSLTHLQNLFRMSAERYPDAPAIVMSGASRTYRECAARVNRLAAGLRRRLCPGVRVAINRYKSIDTILMMIACLEAGMTYVPIDPASPMPRRRFILSDCAASALVVDERTLTEWAADTLPAGLDLVIGPEAVKDQLGPVGIPLSDLAGDLPGSSRILTGLDSCPSGAALGATAIALDGSADDTKDLLQHGTAIQGYGSGTRTPGLNPEAGDGCDPLATDHVPSTEIAGGDLAYILYTSGSTGEPKGVMITHDNAAAFVGWGASYFDIGPGDRVAVHAPLHFDLPVFDIYVGLACGATVYPIPEKDLLFPESVHRFLRNNAVTVLYAVPSALTALLNRSTLRSTSGLPDLRLLLYAGEEFAPAALADLIRAIGDVRVFNLYGPIETNVVTVFKVTPPELERTRIPIGRPVVGTTIHLVDDNGQVIEQNGVEGEIVVVGPSVSPGYLNQPERTAATRWGENGYRTGDYGHWEDGIVHFHGRRDAMVKTRGFRVELGEIEAAIARHPGIAEAVVVARPHPDYTNLIYASVVPRSGASITTGDVEALCRERLPAYMVPHQIEIRGTLPRTSTGKVARRELWQDAAGELLVAGGANR